MNLLKKNHPRKRMIKRNISISEEGHSLLVSWDPCFHVETHFLVHALSFLFAMFKVVVNKEVLYISPQECIYEEGSHIKNKDEYLICLFFVINHI